MKSSQTFLIYKTKNIIKKTNKKVCSRINKLICRQGQMVCFKKVGVLLSLDIQTPGDEVFGAKNHTPNIPKHRTSVGCLMSRVYNPYMWINAFERPCFSGRPFGVSVLASRPFRWDFCHPTFCWGQFRSLEKAKKTVSRGGRKKSFYNWVMDI